MIMGEKLTQWISAFSSRVWPGVIMAFLLGQVVGIHSQGFVQIHHFILLGFYLVLGTASVILLNHFADALPDSMKENYSLNSIRYQLFPSEKQMLWMGVLLGLLSFIPLFVFSKLTGAYHILPFGFLGFILLGVYSFPPFRMNYRGGGEILELLGIAVFIPLFMYYLNAKTLDFSAIMPFLAPFAFLVLSHSLSSSLVHEKSDKYGGKTTWVTVSGSKMARVFLEYSILFFGLSLLLMKYFFLDSLPWLFACIASGTAFYFFMKTRQIPKQINLIDNDSFNLFEFYLNSSILFGMGIVNFGVFYDYLLRP